MLSVSPPTFKPVLQQIRLLQVAKIVTSDWIKLRGSRAIDVSYVTCFGSHPTYPHPVFYVPEML